MHEHCGAIDEAGMVWRGKGRPKATQGEMTVREMRARLNAALARHGVQNRKWGTERIPQAQRAKPHLFSGAGGEVAAEENG